MTNLLCISSYSFGKSCIRIDKYVEKAKALGYTAIGIADHGSMAAFPMFFSECKKQCIHGIGGVLLNFKAQTGINECALIIMDEEGYSNACEILSSKKEVYDADDINETDGLSFVLPTDEFKDLESIKDFCRIYQRKFKSFFLGLSILTKHDVEKVSRIRKFASEYSYECLSFPKVCYLSKSGLFAIDLVNCCLDNRSLTNQELDDEKNGGPNFLLSPASRKQLYDDNELKNDDDLAGKCVFDLFASKRGALLSITGDLEGDYELFQAKCRDGMERRGLIGKKEYEERLNYETKVIKNMGFCSYFLIVEDYVNYAKSSGIYVGPGRGSAAGALVSYVMGITDIDPLLFGLSFERFLNPKRVTMPDIDVDFEDDRQPEIFDYLKKKYGATKTAKIITYGTFKSRSAINNVGKALNINSERLKSFNKTIPVTGLKVATLDEAYKESYSLRKMCEDPYYGRIFKLARSIENLPSHTSNHPAGMIISDKDIFLSVPMSDGTSGIVQYEYQYMEQLGFLKVDLLSLNYLTIIRKIESRIKENGGEIPDYLNLRNDPSTYKTINDLNLYYVFQLNGTGIRKAIQKIHPECFDDLVALLALYRPGPMDNIDTFAMNKKNGTFPTTGYPKLDEILKETYGVLVYQEQVLRIAHEIGGMDMGEADLLRRAISKKHKDDMEKYEAKFIEGAMRNGFSEKDSKGIYGLILKFADYGFNKSHSVSYALITFELAYLKTHEPEAFYAEIFSMAGQGDYQQLANEMKKFGFSINPVNPNISMEKETFKDKCLYLGLDRVKGLTTPMIEKILDERKKGQFTDAADFILRVFSSFDIDPRTFESFIDCGLFDAFEIGRGALEANIQAIIEFKTVALDKSLFPVFSNTKMSRMEMVEAFIRELDAVGMSLSINLRSLVSPSISTKGLSVGVVKEPPIPYGREKKVTLANAYGTRDFFIPANVNLSIYDLVVFMPVVSSKGYWKADKISVDKVSSEK